MTSKILKVRATRYFKHKYQVLRPSQKEYFTNQVLKDLLENPHLGQPGAEEWREYRYHTYEDQYGKTLVCYRVDDQILLLVSLAQISLKI